jgi:maleate isomerase
LLTRGKIFLSLEKLGFARVEEDAPALDQFDPARMLPAADLLADAKVDAMAWNGTSASWLGIERDESLCEAIGARTGKPATTSTLACIDAVRSVGAQRVGLVTPYTDDVQARIGTVWAGAGIACHAERHLGLRAQESFERSAHTRRPRVTIRIRWSLSLCWVV